MGFTPRIRTTGNCWLLGEEESVLYRDKLPDKLASPKKSALDTYK